MRGCACLCFDRRRWQGVSVLERYDKIMGFNTTYINPKKFTTSYVNPKKFSTCPINFQLFWHKWDRYFRFLWTGYIWGSYLVSALPDRRRITVTGMDFITNYIPETSIATFKLAADADFIADDTDGLWFTGGIQNALTVTDLISGDYRTIVKYSNSPPYDISMIGLLRVGVVMTTSILNDLHTDFLLWMFWTGVLNDYGYLKDNRLIP
jgi:hypothetical protein